MRLFVALLLLTAPAFAHDMSDPDADWYRSLKVPGDMGDSLAGSSCCTGPNDPNPDCRNVEVRVRDGHWEAFIDSVTFPDVVIADKPGWTQPLLGHAPNDWVPVPDNVIIRRDNPTGRPVACWYNRTI